MELKGKKVLVIGSGISGIGAVRLLTAKGAGVVLFDSNEALDPAALREKLGADVEAEIYTGTLPLAVAEQIRWVIPSPGVPCDTGMVAEFRDKRIPVTGEIELAYQAEKGTLIGITGTNGKTTTTSLVGEIMKEHYKKVFVVGNIGNPYTTEVSHTSKDSVTVAEISSFQLETVQDFHPHVSAILNITPDHLNRHHTMETYAAVKEKIARKQTPEDTCVLNYENEYTREYAAMCPASVVFFSSARELQNGYFLRDDQIWFAENGKEEGLLNIHTDMNLVGTCNVENVMAAIAIARGMKVPMAAILHAIRKFKAVEHRIEYVAEKAGVVYYNDSKGTNPDAAIQGIKAMSRPTILIGGGYDKKNEYDSWIEAFDGKVKLLVLIGQTREKIAECAQKHGFTDYVFADSFEEAMDLCVKHACPGDAVLLSPACASWGMFPNYEVRGQMFKEYVAGLKE